MYHQKKTFDESTRETRDDLIGAHGDGLRGGDEPESNPGGG